MSVSTQMPVVTMADTLHRHVGLARALEQAVLDRIPGERLTDQSLCSCVYLAGSKRPLRCRENLEDRFPYDPCASR
jgi:hypothetical protein